MKIDKVIWSSSVEYSDFWNINSLIHNKFLGLDCVLLLYGKKKDLGLSEEFGEIIELDFDENAPKIPQLIFNKWHYTKNEPETTWLIGDIDQIPLQKQFFIDKIGGVPEDSYCHLSENECQMSGAPCWKSSRGPLVGHYHVAKGKIFNEVLNLDVSLVDHTNTLVGNSKKDKQPVWAYEEWYTADLIKASKVKFYAFKRKGHGNLGNKICRSTNSSYNPELLKSKIYYEDYHCPRPYEDHKSQINEILKIAWGDI